MQKLKASLKTHANGNGHDSLMAPVLKVKMSPELYERLAAESDRLSVPMAELMVRYAAKHFQEPGFCRVPRRRLGRPRKHKTPTKK